MNRQKRIQVACAIININERILVVQRNEDMVLPLKWEFPGGKIEPGETAEDCVKREVREELNLEIELTSRLSSSCYNYKNILIELIPFTANYIKGELKLSEHKSYLLMEGIELSKLDWAEADLPILSEFLKS